MVCRDHLPFVPESQDSTSFSSPGPSEARKPFPEPWAPWSYLPDVSVFHPRVDYFSFAKPALMIFLSGTRKGWPQDALASLVNWQSAQDSPADWKRWILEVFGRYHIWEWIQDRKQKFIRISIVTKVEKARTASRMWGWFDGFFRQRSILDQSWLSP